MEMIRRKDHDGDKNAKDNVLLEAFEDEPKIPKTTLNKDKESHPQIRNKTKGTDENTSIISTKLVMESNTTRGATDKSKKQSNRSKPFIRKDSNISMNENTFTTKKSSRFMKKMLKTMLVQKMKSFFKMIHLQKKGNCYQMKLVTLPIFSHRSREMELVIGQNILQNNW